MDVSSTHNHDGVQKSHLIKLLRSSRDRLTPIIEDIVVSTVNLLQMGHNRLFSERFLTLEQYQDLLRAFVTLREVQCRLHIDPRACSLPNTDIIVNTASVEDLRKGPNGDNRVVIDEKAVVELLELYEKMGEVIRRMSEECEKVDLPQIEYGKSTKTNSPTTTPGHQNIPAIIVTEADSGKDQSVNPSARGASSLITVEGIRSSNLSKTSQKNTPSQKWSTMTAKDLDLDEDEANKPSPSSSHSKSTILDKDLDVDQDEADKLSPKSSHGKSTASLSRGSIMRRKKSSTTDPTSSSDDVTVREDESSDSEGCSHCMNDIKIKILCNMSETSDEDSSHSLHPAKSESDCYRVKLGEQPVSLKLTQDSISGGGTYCINAGTDDEEQMIRIVVKQCPQCHSTVVSSSTKIDGVDLPEVDGGTKRGTQQSTVGYVSQEITGPGMQDLQKKSGVAVKKSSEIVKEESDAKKSPRSSNGNHNNSKNLRNHNKNEDREGPNAEKCPKNCSPKIVINIAPSTCQKVAEACACEEKSKRSVPKMDVLLDVDSVDKSAIKVLDERRSNVIEPEKRKKEASVKPLMRGRICSSMEFDVTTADTRMRQQQMENGNEKVVIELRNLGVDQVLRACRPAKCCRKAILNEKQRTGLPYCVSLRSLPLLANDVDVIQQSIDMSVKKIKNSVNLSEERKAKFAYYVTLESDPFAANVNFPWVVPVYDARIDLNKAPNDIYGDIDKMYVLKKAVGIENIGNIDSLLKLVGNKEAFAKQTKRKRFRDSKFYILKKPRVDELTSSSEDSCLFTTMQSKKWTGQIKRVKFEENNRNDTSYMYKIVKINRPQRQFLLKKACRTIGYERTTRKRVFFKETSVKDVFFDFDETEESAYGCTISETLSPVLYQKSPHYKTKNFTENRLFNKRNTNNLCGDHLQVKTNGTISDTKILKNLEMPSTLWRHVSEEQTSKALAFLPRENLNREYIQKLRYDICGQNMEKLKKKQLDNYIGLTKGNHLWGNNVYQNNFKVYYSDNNKSYTAVDNKLSQSRMRRRNRTDNFGTTSVDKQGASKVRLKEVMGKMVIDKLKASTKSSGRKKTCPEHKFTKCLSNCLKPSNGYVIDFKKIPENKSHIKPVLRPCVEKEVYEIYKNKAANGSVKDKKLFTTTDDDNLQVYVLNKKIPNLTTKK